MIFLLAMCKHLPTEEVLPVNTSRNNPVAPQKDTICFSSDILPLIISTCAKPGCHDATYRKEGYNLTTYSGIMQLVWAGNANNSALYSYAKYGASQMHISYPSSQTLTKITDTTSLNKLLKWINQGAVNSICNNCDTTNVKFSTHVWPLIQSNCLGCHLSSTTLLTNYSQVKTVADNGKLYCAISWAGSCQNMPQGGVKLSDCKIRAVKIWIDAGSPNN